jgi:hypothetical protein
MSDNGCADSMRVPEAATSTNHIRRNSRLRRTDAVDYQEHDWLPKRWFV